MGIEGRRLGREQFLYRICVIEVSEVLKLGGEVVVRELKS